MSGLPSWYLQIKQLEIFQFYGSFVESLFADPSMCLDRDLSCLLKHLCWLPLFCPQMCLFHDFSWGCSPQGARWPSRPSETFPLSWSPQLVLHPHVSIKTSSWLHTKRQTSNMDNLIDFDQPSAASSLCVEPHHQAHSDIFSPEPRSSVHQAPFLPEPLAPTKAGSQRADGHNEDSDATESADSENDMDPPSLDWELRRSSSSSAHSVEDADTESIERRQFMKAYVEKVFHGK